MAAAERLICRSGELAEGGAGIRFELPGAREPLPAFVVRHDGVVRAYVNRCPHVPTELDWEPGRFFDGEGLLLICSNHGAVFLPDTGECIGGPCRGKRLTPIGVEEREGMIYAKESDDA